MFTYNALWVFKGQKRAQKLIFYSSLNALVLRTLPKLISTFLNLPLDINYDFKLNPQSTTTIEGHTVVLNCLPPTSHPSNPHINWFFNYSKIFTNSNSRYHYITNGSLVITETRRHDKGVYFCQAVNVFSKVARTSTIAFVNILGKFYSWDSSLYPPPQRKKKYILSITLVL